MKGLNLCQKFLVVVRKKMNNLYNFSKDNKVFKNRYNYNPYHPDGEEYKYLIFLDDIPLTKDYIFWYKKSEFHFYLGYIGFVEKYQNKGILKNYIHPHCIEYFKNKGVTKITLKPLVSALLVWISLEFEFIKDYEKIRTKLTIINYLKTKNIIKNDDILRYDTMELIDIVKLHKKNFDEDFPIFIEKNLYYTNLKKDIL